MKIYRFYGLNTAIDLLRPGAKWEWTGELGFTLWDDARPQPSIEEIEATMKKIKFFEDSIDTIWLDDQMQMFEKLLSIPGLRCNDGFHRIKDFKSENITVHQNGIIINEDLERDN